MEVSPNQRPQVPEVAGSLIALHGNGGGGYRFHRLEPHIPAEIAFFAVTLPGFGFAPSDPGIRDLRGFAHWLRREVIPNTPSPRYLLGQGIGGSIALEYLQHFAGDIDGVILHAPVGADLDRRWFPRLMRLPGMRSAAQALLGSPWMEPLWRRLLFRKALPPEVLRRFFAEYRACQVFGELFDWIDARWFHSLRPVDVPAILLWGERERVLRTSQAAAFRRVVPRAEVLLVPHWDHFPMLEEPASYAATLLRCIRSLHARGTAMAATEGSR